MKIILKLLLFLAFFLNNRFVDGMTIKYVKPDNMVLNKLVTFHQPTTSYEGSEIPIMENYHQPNRSFIAKIGPSYFSFATNSDAARLVQLVRGGAGWKVEWFYHD